MSDPRYMLAWVRQYGGSTHEKGPEPCRVSGARNKNSSAYAGSTYRGIAYGAMRNSQLQLEINAARARGDDDLADYLDRLLADRWLRTFPPQGGAA